MSLLLLLAAGAMAEEQQPRVPWSKIEAWTSPDGSSASDNAPDSTPAGNTPTNPSASATTTAPSNSTAVPDAASLRSGAKRSSPAIWQERYEQIAAVMSARLARASKASQYQQLFEVTYMMEQYDKAITHLTNMVKDPGKYSKGWIAGRLWETALMQGGTPNPEVLKRYFDEWQTEERDRLRIQASTLSESSLKRQKEIFAAHQAFFNDFKNIADLIKQKELEGESNPDALWEMIERFHRGNPDAPVVLLRFLYKLREWHPEFSQVRNGEVQELIASTLASERMRLFKEAAEEAELCIQKWPEASYPTSGYADYYAATYWMSYGDTLKDSRDMKGAREAWQKALEHAQKLRTGFEKKGPNTVEASSGHSKTDRLFGSLKDESRLGARM